MGRCIWAALPQAGKLCKRVLMGREGRRGSQKAEGGNLGPASLKELEEETEQGANEELSDQEAEV